MSEKTLKFDNIRVNKKEFHESMQLVNLDLKNVDRIVLSDKFQYSDDGFKYFIGYKEGKIVKPLCIILPQTTGYIKYFENRGKNMSFVIRDDMCLNKYNEIWKFDTDTCIACITIGSVMRMEKKNYLQVYLQCKYRIKKTKLTKFIEAELESYFCNLDVRFNVRFYLRL